MNIMGEVEGICIHHDLLQRTIAKTWATLQQRAKKVMCQNYPKVVWIEVFLAD